jgi:hypothetical protein
MPTIHIGPETDDKARRCWGYEVRVTDDAGGSHDYRVTLSWSDYDLWSHGRIAPEKVVHAVFRYLLQREGPDRILSKFDCGVVRRYFPQVDRELPGML